MFVLYMLLILDNHAELYGRRGKRKMVVICLEEAKFLVTPNN
jgi:hypothetical protein